MKHKLIFVVLAALALAGCREEAAPAPKPQAVEAAPSKLAARPAAAEIVTAPAGAEPVDTIVRREAERARADQRDLLVYVGAEWCEPCKRFHEAVVSGQLNDTFPTLRLLEFDLDHDRDRLTAAGYASRMIPLFAVPGPDGRGTERRIQGAVKGEGAVANIVPRLKELLSPAQ
jgi:thiol:disulfide interchange protein